VEARAARLPMQDRRKRQVVTPEGVPLPFTIGARGRGRSPC
jgi:hypothetical protein